MDSSASLIVAERHESEREGTVASGVNKRNKWANRLLITISLLSLFNIFLSQYLPKVFDNDTTKHYHQVVAPRDPRGSTVENSELRDELLVLRNVCLERTDGGTRDVMQFFSPTSDEVWEAGRNMRIFNENSKRYTAWDSDIINTTLAPALMKVQAELVANTTMDSWMRGRNVSRVSFMDGTTVVAEPHFVDNNFHVHNDLILSLLYKVIKSGDRQQAHKMRLYLTHASKKRFDNRVVAFDVLHGLFDDVLYPLEELLSDDGSVCFERLIWGGRAVFPYYSDVGRFGINEKWKGVVPEIRDWVNEAHGIKSERNAPAELATEQPHIQPKPRLTWIDRPCLGKEDSRCFRAADKLHSHLSSKFDVQVLSFDRTKDRSEQLHAMLTLMAKTDILMGIHGAGLGHIVYLQPDTIVVEIQGKPNRSKKLFLNMASKQDIGYYVFDALKAAQDSGVVLNDDQMDRFADDLWTVWGEEAKFREQKARLSSQNNNTEMARGECVFPRYLSDTQLSTFEFSRCYLEQNRRKDTWYQCSRFNQCPK